MNTLKNYVGGGIGGMAKKVSLLVLSVALTVSLIGCGEEGKVSGGSFNKTNDVGGYSSFPTTKEEIQEYNYYNNGGDTNYIADESKYNNTETGEFEESSPLGFFSSDN